MKKCSKNFKNDIAKIIYIWYNLFVERFIFSAFNIAIKILRRYTNEHKRNFQQVCQ